MPTAGICKGFLQANMVVLPAKYGIAFEKFCVLNSKACPILEIVPSGHRTKVIADKADIRTDLPKYRIYEGDGHKEVHDLLTFWKEDSVTFFLGCSFSWEEALAKAGVRLRHIENNTNVSMYETSVTLKPNPPFEGKLTTSMRPINNGQVELVKKLTKLYPKAHGGPIHVGSPEELGIDDLQKVDFGDPVEIHDGETAVFWACGVTSSQVVRGAVARKEIPWAVSHAPGFMFVADIKLDAVERICRNHVSLRTVTKDPERFYQNIDEWHFDEEKTNAAYFFGDASTQG